MGHVMRALWHRTVVQLIVSVLGGGTVMLPIITLILVLTLIIWLLIF